MAFARIRVTTSEPLPIGEAVFARAAARAVYRIVGADAVLAFRVRSRYTEVLLEVAPLAPGEDVGDARPAWRVAHDLGLALKHLGGRGGAASSTVATVAAHDLAAAVRAVLIPRRLEYVGEHDEASAVPELFGIRRLAPGLGARLARHVRGLRRILGAHRILRRSLSYAFHPGSLVDSAAAAIGAPDLRGKEPEVVAARAAAFAIAIPRVGAREAARLLGTGRATAYRHRGGEVDLGLVDAIQWQMRLRAPRELPRPPLEPPRLREPIHPADRIARWAEGSGRRGSAGDAAPGPDTGVSRPRRGRGGAGVSRPARGPDRPPGDGPGKVPSTGSPQRVRAGTPLVAQRPGEARPGDGPRPRRVAPSGEPGRAASGNHGT